MWASLALYIHKGAVLGTPTRVKRKSHAKDYAADGVGGITSHLDLIICCNREPSGPKPDGLCITGTYDP